MEAGPAHSVAKVSSRTTFSKPPFSRPPFPQNIPAARVLVSVPMAQPPVPRAPIMILNRMPVQPNPGSIHQGVQTAPKNPAPQNPRPPAQAQGQRNQGQRSAGQGQGAAGNAKRSSRQGRGNWRKKKDEPVEKKIVVTGYPSYTTPQDLLHPFAEYGDVRVERFTKKAALLRFGSVESAQAAQQAGAGANIYGQFLAVKPYAKDMESLFHDVNSKKNVKSKPKGPSVDPNSITLSGSFAQQLDALLAAVRLSPSEISQLVTLYRDLETVLRGIWPGCRAIPFGSVTTGLGVKSSDADCFMMLPNRSFTVTAVSRARRVLGQYPRLFAELLAIPRANTPIVKCYHLPTRTYCDLSFKTPLGSQNSKLISFLLNADPRLLPLAVTIKYWASVHQLTGTGKLTNYALTMMIIFYLQRPPLSILPAVLWLQREAANDYIVDGWNTGISNELPPCTNTSSVAELLGGFFEFYSQFNFNEYVVSPFVGYPVEKHLFRETRHLPYEFERYKENVANRVTPTMRANTAMCVQDPFEQCHNVASAVSAHLASDIRAYMKFAADAYDKEKLNGCKNFLKTILFEKPVLPRPKNISTFRVRLPQKTLVHFKDDNWVDVMRKVIFTIFETILNIKLEKVEPGQERGDSTERDDSEDEGEEENEDSNGERENEDSNGQGENEDTERDRRNSEDEDEDDLPVYPLKKEKETYKGTITRAIWKRKQFSKLYSYMQMRFFERERKITEELLKVDRNVIDVEVTLELTFRLAPRGAALAVSGRPGRGAAEASHFKEFGKFYLAVMRKWFTILCHPHCYRPSTCLPPLPRNCDIDDEMTPEAARYRVCAENLARELACMADTDHSDSDSFGFADERAPRVQYAGCDQDSSPSSSSGSTNETNKDDSRGTRSLEGDDKDGKISDEKTSAESGTDELINSAVGEESDAKTTREPAPEETS